MKLSPIYRKKLWPFLLLAAALLALLPFALLFDRRFLRAGAGLAILIASFLGGSVGSVIKIVQARRRLKAGRPDLVSEIKRGEVW